MKKLIKQYINFEILRIIKMNVKHSLDKKLYQQFDHEAYFKLFLEVWYKTGKIEHNIMYKLKRDLNERKFYR